MSFEAIQAKNLFKKYGNVQAVAGVTFSVAAGEVFGFLGPNGAGKTTTQRILTGIVEPDQGEVLIMGYHLKKQPYHAKRMMGVVPELANVYVDLSARDNLLFIGELYGVPKKMRAKRADELLEIFGLKEKRHFKARGFSKGMKQRLLLGMALMSDPEVLILDEPTSGLDVQSTRLIRDLIKKFNERGKTVFLTTHNIEEAGQLCDRVAIINQGKLVAVDRPEKLKCMLQRLQSVVVAFHPQVIESQLLAALEGVNQVKKSGDRFILYTDHPGDVVLAVAELARRENLKILSLHTQGPTLEDVFLHLTDHQ